MKPLARLLGCDVVVPCDVEDVASVDAAFAAPRKAGPRSTSSSTIAFSDKNELKGRYVDTTRTNFCRTMVISCFSFTEVAKRAGRRCRRGRDAHPHL